MRHVKATQGRIYWSGSADWWGVVLSASTFAVCVQTIGDELVDSIVSDNIPVLAEDAKFNEAVTSSLRRIEVGPCRGRRVQGG
jgi:hypothetical protein